MKKLTIDKQKAKIGYRLKLTRLAMNYKTIAELASELEWKDKHLGRYEAGARIPRDLNELKKLCEHLGVTTDWLLLGDRSALQPETLTRLNSVESHLRAKRQ